MNTELKTVLFDMINTIAEAKNFVLAELPDVVEQLLTWHLVESLIFFTLGIMIIIISFALWRLLGNHLKATNNCEQGVEYLILVIGNLIGWITIFVNLNWLKILIAPKLYLVEYAARMAG